MKNDSLSRRRCIELRQAEDLKKHYDGLILPGGESTVQGKLLRELGMFDIIKKADRGRSSSPCDLRRNDSFSLCY